jgi:hypothetical protein
LQVIRKRSQTVVEGFLKLSSGRFHGALDPCGGFQQVGTADISDKNEIACRQRNGLIRPASQIRDEIAQMLRCVARGVDRLDANIADQEMIAMLEEMRVGPLGRPPIRPIRCAFR